MIHSGITPEWVLSRIAIQLGVKNPDEDPLKILKGRIKSGARLVADAEGDSLRFDRQQ